MIDKEILQKDMYKIWEKDFEYDNFGTNKIVDEINLMFKEKNYNYEITIEEVNNELNNKVLKKAIKDVFHNKYNKKFDDFIKTPDISKRLIKDRIYTIRKDGWNPQLPLEEVLEYLFNKYPEILG